LGAQLGQVLPVHMHEAKIVVFEGPGRLAGAACRRQTAQALGLPDAVDRVPIEMRQKVRDHEGEVIPRKARRTPQRADDGPLFLGSFPGQLVRPAGVVLTVGSPALAPLADRLGRDAIALGQDPGWLSGSSNLGPDGRGGASLGVDRWGGSLGWIVGVDRGPQRAPRVPGAPRELSKRQAYASIAQRT
jgi:hypothetical protein